MMEIVFTSPQQLHGNTHLLGNGSGFVQVVVGQATAEPAAGPLHLHDNVARRNPRTFGTDWGPDSQLAWRPELQLAVVKVRGAILRLHGRVR